MHKPLILGCCHSFCSECIETWMLQSKSCPVCNSIIQKNAIQEYFAVYGMLHFIQSVNAQLQSVFNCQGRYWYLYCIYIRAVPWIMCIVHDVTNKFVSKYDLSHNKIIICFEAQMSVICTYCAIVFSILYLVMELIHI